MSGHPEGRNGVVAAKRRIAFGLAGLLVALPAIAATEQGRGEVVAIAQRAGPDTASVDAVNATPFRYLRIPGMAFHPVDSATGFGYSGVGCINRTGATSSLFTHKVVLPQGSVVKYLRLYYNDASSSDITAFFTSYDHAGGFVQHASTASTGSSGFGFSVSPEIAHVVDHYQEPLVVTVNMDASVDASLQLCGVRIAYYDVEDDTIFRNGFD